MGCKFSIAEMFIFRHVVQYVQEIVQVGLCRECAVDVVRKNYAVFPVVIT